MRVYFDTEFTGLHQHTTLISIGCVSDDNRTFYAELTDYDPTQVDAWIREHVLAHLWHPESPTQGPWIVDRSNPHHSFCGTRAQLSAALREWLGQWDRVEMWSDLYAYDWVLFCELFGGAFGVPSNVYYIPFDLSTALRLNGHDPDVRRTEFANMPDAVRHHALDDAQVIRACVAKLGISP